MAWAPASAELRRVGSIDLPSGSLAFNAVAVATDGDIYGIVGFKTVNRYSSSGTLLASWGGPSAGAGEFGAASVVATAPGGTVLLNDRSHNRVARYDRNGALVAGYSIADPNGLAVAPDATLYVSSAGDPPGPDIRHLTADGSQLSRWVGTDAAHLTVDRQGTVFASVPVDVQRAQVWRFASDGQVEARFPSTAGNEPGSLERGSPRGLAATAGGTVWVADTPNRRINEYTRDGGYLRSCGGREPGPSALQAPVDVAVAPNGDLYVADGYSIVHLSENAPADAMSCNLPLPVTPAPTFSEVKVTPTRFRAAPSPLSSRRGGRLKFKLSSLAQVTMTMYRRLAGRLVGGRCLAARPSARGPRCTREAFVTRRKIQARRYSIEWRISGWLGQRRLRPGSYVIKLVAEDQGKRSRTVRARFTLVGS